MKNTRSWILGLAVAVAFWGYPTAARAFDHGHDGQGQSGQSGDHGHDGDHGDHGQGNTPNTPALPAPPDNRGHDDGDDNHGADNNQINNQNRARVSFAVQPAGANIAAEGRVDVRSDGQRERLKVEVEANVPDGTVFMVFANAPSTAACNQGMPLGPVQMQLGEVELEFDNHEGQALPGGLSVSAINSVCVVDAQGTPILSAQFGMPPAPPSTVQPVAGVQRRQAVLVATTEGMKLGAEGQVELRAQGQQERLKVRVEAKAGTMFAVFGIANGMSFPLGTLTLSLGEAELQLENNNSTMLPVALSSITEIQITAPDGTLLLSAKLPM